MRQQRSLNNCLPPRENTTMKINRRKFLEASALTVAGSLVASAEVPGSATQNGSRRNTVRSLKAHDGKVRGLLSRMTLEEKIGQMVQAESAFTQRSKRRREVFPGLIAQRRQLDPKSGNGLIDWTDLYDSLQIAHAKYAPAHSDSLRYRRCAWTQQRARRRDLSTQHRTRLHAKSKLVEHAARITAIETRATGINWTFAPCVTVPRDERWGRTYEGFGETPELARMLGEAAVRGYQGNDLSDPLRILACAKHWIGDGGTNYGTGRKLKDDVQILDRGDIRATEQDLRDVHMAGYVSAIKAGVGTIMPSYSSWNGVKCSGSKRLLTEILKEELKFDGFLISDYDAIDEMPGDYKSQIETSVNAGMDMFMVSTNVS